MFVLIFSKHSSQTLIVPTRTQRYIAQNAHRSLRKVPIIFVRFEANLTFLDRFSRNPQTSNFLKFCPVGTVLFHEDRRTENMKKLIVALHNFAKAPQNRKVPGINSNQTDGLHK